MSFRINRVYTRSGDSGETGLVGGRRVSKTDLRVCAYGDVDELNSVLGLCKCEVGKSTTELGTLLEFLQQELFDLGSELATHPSDSYEGMWKVAAEHVARLEHFCDAYGDALPELTSFILPGGSKLVSCLHLARTVSRRAERTVLTLASEGGSNAVNPELVKYLNRLSDLFFILARWSLEREKASPPQWVQEKQRKAPPDPKAGQ